MRVKRFILVIYVKKRKKNQFLNLLVNGFQIVLENGMNIRMELMKILDLKRLKMKLIILQAMVMQKRVGYPLTIIGISLKIQVV